MLEGSQHNPRLNSDQLTDNDKARAGGLMNYQLKSISKAGIAEALAKVELYRYLNEPEESESICRDILAVDPHQQLALRLLGLSITDQFNGGVSDRCQEAEELFARLTDRYEQLYYNV